ncbi:hypothetical protein D3C73_1048900 [compost metagenome]
MAEFLRVIWPKPAGWGLAEDRRPLPFDAERPKYRAIEKISICNREHRSDLAKLKVAKGSVDSGEALQPRYAGSSGVGEHRHDADVADLNCEGVFVCEVDVVVSLAVDARLNFIKAY